MRQTSHKRKAHFKVRHVLANWIAFGKIIKHRKYAKSVGEVMIRYQIVVLDNFMQQNIDLQAVFVDDRMVLEIRHDLWGF